MVRSDFVDTFHTESVPLGILDKVLGHTLSLTLQEGDTAVLVSDGAVDAGADYLRAVLSEKSGKPRRGLPNLPPPAPTLMRRTRMISPY